MGKEIERKYLVSGTQWKDAAAGTLYRQGYLNSQKERVVRVRTMGDKAALTIKGISVGATRLEFEYDIPFEDCQQLLELCEQPLIEKTRYHVHCHGKLWEVDVFEGDNKGLTVAEVELQSKDEAIILPEWAAEEVTSDKRYYNVCLVNHPYKDW